jgi:hypothetical protein
LPDSLQLILCGENELISIPNKLPTSLTSLWCNANPKLLKLPDDIPEHLEQLGCSGHTYLNVPEKYAIRFGMKQTPNYETYARPIQLIYKAKYRKKRLRFLKQLQEHIDEFRFRPNNAGYQEVKTMFQQIATVSTQQISN